MKVGRLHLGTVAFLSFLILNSRTATYAADDEHGKREGQFIPTGVQITSQAAKGSLFQPLNPDLSFDPAFTAGHAVTTAVSPDGSTLLILTSGYNRQNFTSGPNRGSANPAESNEYVFVYDISGSTPAKKQVVRVPNAFDGLAWNPSGREFYVTGGKDDNVHIYVRGQAVWAEVANSPVALGHGQAIGMGNVTPGAAGVAVTEDGKRLVVANYENDSISVVDIPSRTKVGELDLRPGKGIPGGEYPFWVAIKGNDTAFVSSERDREVVVVDISAPQPVVTDRTRLTGQPNRLLLNKKQNRLFVAEASSDSVAVISASSHKILGEINTTAPTSIFENRRGYKGSSPNSLALSHQEDRLYVTNAGANSVAVIDLEGQSDSDRAKDWQGGKVIGLIPTGWYPNSVSLSADDSTLYVVDGKSKAGPNPEHCRDKRSLAVKNGTTRDSETPCHASNQYIYQLTKAGFLTLPVPQGEELEELTEQVAQNNRYRRDPDSDPEERLMAKLRENVKHVIYIVKENRSYDQILGDLAKGNGDPSLVVYPRLVTPNQHALANRFVDLDNFYDSAQTSGDGWNWSTSARAADTIEKTLPMNYADRGLSYDYEGKNRNINMGLGTVIDRQVANPLTPSDPNILPSTADVSAPDSPDGEAGTGYIWDSALRAGITIRNYGFFVDLGRYSLPASSPAAISPNLIDPFSTRTQVAFATKVALRPVTDPYFRGYDNQFPDFYRVNEWEREFDQFEENGNLPNLELVRIMHDHTGNFGTAIAGVNTPEIQTADNDYAVGRIVEKVSRSPRYKDNTLIFIVEDDAQDGPDRCPTQHRVRRRGVREARSRRFAKIHHRKHDQHDRANSRDRLSRTE